MKKYKKWFVKDKVDEKNFISVCESSESMSKAAAELGLHFNSFKKRALELGCYKPNQAGVGLKKERPKIPIQNIIIEGKQPQYQTYKLKKRLITEGYKQNKCEECGIEDWNNKELNMELDHIDGDRTNHLIENLRIICPNCHAQTSTYRAKNKRHKM
jgi:5-methylcytosine-specific restriction endonuclease McrA